MGLCWWRLFGRRLPRFLLPALVEREFGRCYFLGTLAAPRGLRFVLNLVERAVSEQAVDSVCRPRHVLPFKHSRAEVV
jgi:hypothetical protein